MGNKRCTDHEVARFGFRMQQLLDAGIPILRALSVLDSSWNKRERVRYNKLGMLLKSGLSVSEALHSLSFPLFFCSLVAFAEQHGQMSDTLELAATYYLKKFKRKKHLWKSMVYPILVILSSCGTLVLISTVLLPQFASLYSTLGVTLPLFMRWFISLSIYRKEFSFSFFSIVTLIFGVLLFLKFKRFPFEHCIIRIPLFARVFLIHVNSIVCFQSGLLLDGGISILEICRLFREESHSSLIRGAFDVVEEELRNGNPLSSAFGKVDWILPLVIEMVCVAEQSGLMGSSLKQIGQQLEEEFEERFTRMMHWIQNLLLVGTGGIVLTMLLSLFVPMLSVISQL